MNRIQLKDALAQEDILIQELTDHLPKGYSVSIQACQGLIYGGSGGFYIWYSITSRGKRVCWVEVKSPFLRVFVGDLPNYNKDTPIVFNLAEPNSIEEFLLLVATKIAEARNMTPPLMGKIVEKLSGNDKGIIHKQTAKNTK